MPYPEAGAGYEHKPKFVERMRVAERTIGGGVNVSSGSYDPVKDVKGQIENQRDLRDMREPSLAGPDFGSSPLNNTTDKTPDFQGRQKWNRIT